MGREIFVTETRIHINFLNLKITRLLVPFAPAAPQWGDKKKKNECRIYIYIHVNVMCFNLYIS